MNLSSHPHLLLHTDSGARHIPLVGTNCWTIGRNEDNNLTLGDRWISRNHAMLQLMENGEFYLIDLGSRNGSFVNGRRVSVPVTLHDGDRITFGQTELNFYCPSQPPTEPSPELSESQDISATAALHVRRLISVMVIDIRNFTGLTRQMDERLLSEAIGNWFRKSGHIIRQHGSWVDKYIGDAVMAVWFHSGEGVSREEIVHICQTIRDLSELTDVLNRRYAFPFPMRIGVGVNTGYAMVGNTGSSDRPDYTALGDTVNAAFRLESTTKHIGADIALGKTTYHYLHTLAQGQIEFEQHAVTLKGYDSPTATYATSFENLNRFLQQGE